MIEVKSSGDFDKTEAFLRKMSKGEVFKVLHRFGQMGVQILATSTPMDSGETARSWYYETKLEKGTYSIIWGNTHVENGRPIAILIQYGHGTRTGGYVQGRDYINPALRPIFDRMAAEVWQEVTK